MIAVAITAITTGRHRPPTKLSSVPQALQARIDNKWLRWAATSFLADQADAIGQQRSVEERANAFVREFENRYFPLESGIVDAAMDGFYFGDDWDINTGNLAYMAHNIPTACAGFNQEMTHDLWNVYPKSICLCAMLIRPSDLEQGEDDELWTVWAEMALHKGVPQELIEAMPQGGATMAQLEAALFATPFKGAYAAASWISGTTGNLIADIYDPVTQLGSSFQDCWCMEDILGITETWREAKTIIDAMDKYLAWLEEGDINANHAAALEFIGRRLEETKEQALALEKQRQNRQYGTTPFRMRDTAVDDQTERD